MIPMEKIFFLSLLFLGLASSSGPVQAEEEIRVVATTKTFADLVKSVGGDRVEMDHVAPPNQNVHFIEPRPSDVLRLSKADLFVHSGLDLELWRYPLAEASGKSAFLPGRSRELALARGVTLLEVPPPGVSRAQGDIHVFGNPHYWLDPRNGKILAATICEKLSELDPSHAQDFENNRDRFLEKLDRKIAEWQSSLAPYKGTPVVTYHNSWPYFARFAGLDVVGFIEPKPGIPPTPRHVAFLLALLKEKNVKLIFKEPYFENRTPRKLARATEARVLTLAHGVGEIKEAGDYVTLFDHNVRVLIEAFRESR
jgi:ABC-type Zn uptake system ZnuABC Zn-binding protein ZnuA